MGYLFAAIFGVAGILMVVGLKNDLAPRPIAEATPAVIAPPPLSEHTARAIELSNTKLSPARKATLTTMLSFIAEQVFDNRNHQEFWVALIGVESGYVGTAKSNKGATGLGQLMPQYRADFGKSCGMTEVDAADLNDDFTNAYLSACFFRELIKIHGTVPLAVVSYNAGSYSHSVKKVKAGGVPVEEAAGYATKVWFKNQNVKQQLTQKDINK